MDHGAAGPSAERLVDLLGRVAEGDRAAFAELYQLTAPKLLGIAIALLRSRDRAEEVLQDGYLAIWRHACRYDPAKGSPEAWMATIVRRLAIDRLRAAKRAPLDNAPGGDDLLETVMGSVEAGSLEGRDLARCLENLGEEARQAIVLAYYFGLTHEELAARMEAPLGTVKSWIRRGLLQLKDCLDP